MSAVASTPARGNFTLNEFLAWAGIGRTMAYAEAKAGRLIIMKCGNRTLIRVEDAESWRASLPRLHATS